MEPKSRRTTNRHAGVAAVLAFITQPIPAADEIIVIPVHYWLAVRMARIHDVPVHKLPWRSIQRIIWYGAAARLVVNFSLGFVPWLGAFANAVTAVALTEYLGRYLDELIAHPDLPPPEITLEGLKTLFENALTAKAAATRGQKPTTGP